MSDDSFKWPSGKIDFLDMAFSCDAPDEIDLVAGMTDAQIYAKYGLGGLNRLKLASQIKQATTNQRPGLN